MTLIENDPKKLLSGKKETKSPLNTRDFFLIKLCVITLILFELIRNYVMYRLTFFVDTYLQLDCT